MRYTTSDFTLHSQEPWWYNRQSRLAVTVPAPGSPCKVLQATQNQSRTPVRAERTPGGQETRKFSVLSSWPSFEEPWQAVVEASAFDGGNGDITIVEIARNVAGAKELHRCWRNLYRHEPLGEE